MAFAMTIICEHAWGQLVISAKSGLINHVEGLVLLSGEPVIRKPGIRVEMKEGSELRAEDGRAGRCFQSGQPCASAKTVRCA